MKKASFGYTARDVANWFINATDRESGDDITHLKVQKLVYYAQAWALAYFDKPLFDEDMQAWAHGPVAPSLWENFKIFGYDSIPEQSVERKISGQEYQLLSAVNRKYGEFSAKKLERMTHQEDPWKNARGDLSPEARCDAVIPKPDMRRYFLGRLKSKK